MLRCVGALLWLLTLAPHVRAHTTADNAGYCARPPVGAEVAEPPVLRSVHGQLRADLAIYDERWPDGEVRYCYRTPDGAQAPTLRVHPGDLVVLHLSNHLRDLGSSAHHHADAANSPDPCRRGAMAPTATNLHFHGMNLPPLCHQDEVLQTSIVPGDPPFEYRFTVPAGQPPGLYWYHPHIHGFSAAQVTGGASGAIIVEGLERAIPEVSGLAERLLVIRDLNLVHPDAAPSTAEPVVPAPTLDADGDIANNHTGFGKPARDLSINFVAVPYPDYPPARIKLRPHERQLWRVLNASAITYLHLTLLYDKRPQNLGVVAIDGTPVNAGDPAAPRVKQVDHLAIPPGSRAEIIVQGPAAQEHGLLITRTVDTGQDGENDPNRALASVEPSDAADEPALHLPLHGASQPASALPWVGDTTPLRTRKLFFSERRADPDDPMSPTLFFLTADGETPALFDPSKPPAIVVHQGDVEDWIIENRSLELHDFHIHQIHFQLREWYGYEVNEPFLRDTVSVPYFDNRNTAYPSIRIRMDFRSPDSVGTFLYHCHLLEHEDGGMMGVIRVEPAEHAAAASALTPRDSYVN